ncbi:MAG: DEAD/DEAH box helicase [Chloroflexi bacterium]|nr:DEAD/DEAH box helicase [Chloroflexota bacterium]
MTDSSAAYFKHPAVSAWFESKFAAPTDSQAAAWPAIAAGDDVLLAAPTGSGKTLAAFLWGIDELAEQIPARPEPESVEIVYVSPLKALSNDISRNLRQPLREMRAGHPNAIGSMPEIRVGLRTGDTTQKDREAIYRRPPHILVTTPESLFLLLGSVRGRKALSGVRTVIVDEIHSLARDRRGSHLALSLARLDALTGRRAQRIGLSATQKPLSEIAQFLCGNDSGRPRPCRILDFGHQRRIDLAVEVMDVELGAVASGEYMAALYARVADLVNEHRTTLVFVNTRSLSERVAFNLAERLGEDVVASHHGSLAKERRLNVEQRLKAGQLRALVATASLELGIDVGHIDLVLQVGSPRSIAAFLQRIGRSGHAIDLIPKGRLLPTSRDDVLECAAIVRAARAGILDRVVLLERPLDVLAQHVVAESAARSCSEDELFALFRDAGTYHELTRPEFDSVLELMSEGLGSGGGRGYPLIHRDQINGTVRGRRAARMVAATNAGTIPEQGDYLVVAEPDEAVVGSVNEDFAIESMAGDIFILGTNSWKILRVEPGRVRVADAHGAPPTIPFWLGEGLGRTPELSHQVSRLRGDLAEALDEGNSARTKLAEDCGLTEAALGLLLDYVRATRDGLGMVPTDTDVVFERFFDEAGGMQLVVHAPFGQRITKAWGLALRKRFCVRFDFELQAAANDNCILLSLGPQHSFPLQESFSYVTSDNARPSLRQAILYTPLFPTRWRWNATRALFVRRFQNGRRVPPPIQRMRADDLLAAVFPEQVGCQENVTGPLEIPDHVLVHQTVEDCLFEAHDVKGLEEIMRRIESGQIRLHARDVTEPSPMSHEIINGRPFTFLDDAPLEERRSRAVQLRQVLPLEQRELGALDPAAIAQVLAEIAPDPRDCDELHELLFSLVIVRVSALEQWSHLMDELVAANRARRLQLDGAEFWFAAESAAMVGALFPEAGVDLGGIPERALAAFESPDEVRIRAVRGHCEICGPVTPAQIAERTGLSEVDAQIGLTQIEGLGHVLRGQFEGDGQAYCDRQLLARIHRRTRARLRAEIAPVTRQDFLRFLMNWQFLGPDTRLQGRAGLRRAILRLQGYEAPAPAWEGELLPARVSDYDPALLDELCLAGEVTWLRLSVPGNGRSGPSRRSATRATRIALMPRRQLPLLLAAARGSEDPLDGLTDGTRELFEILRQKGALFFEDLIGHSGRLPEDVERRLLELVAAGLVNSDGYASIRALSNRQLARRLRRGNFAGRRQGLLNDAWPPGRWAAILPATAPPDEEAVLDGIAEVLLERYGVVFRELATRERWRVPWRLLLRRLRLMEARGTIRGGRFVSGLTGEQFALPEALEALRRQRRTSPSVELAPGADDPANLADYLDRSPAERYRS